MANSDSAVEEHMLRLKLESFEWWRSAVKRSNVIYSINVMFQYWNRNSYSYIHFASDLLWQWVKLIWSNAVDGGEAGT